MYYAIPVHPSGKYNVHLRGMTADLGLWVYGNDETYNISAPTCHSLNSGTEDELCSFQGASEGTLYLRVMIPAMTQAITVWRSNPCQSKKSPRCQRPSTIRPR